MNDSTNDLPPDHPLQRLAASVDKLDGRAHEILAYHAATEQELDLAIARLLPHPDRLKGLGFGHKIGVWAAANPLGTTGPTVKALLRLNDLRNAIAHGDTPTQVSAALERLVAETPLGDALKGDNRLAYAVSFIFGGLNSNLDGLKIRGAAGRES